MNGVAIVIAFANEGGARTVGRSPFDTCLFKQFVNHSAESRKDVTVERVESAAGMIGRGGEGGEENARFSTGPFAKITTRFAFPLPEFPIIDLFESSGTD